MVARGVHTEQRAIQHVREPGERVPIAGITAGESPGDAGPGDARVDVVVFENVLRIVEADETIPRQWPVGDQSEHRKTQASGNEATMQTGPGWHWLLINNEHLVSQWANGPMGQYSVFSFQCSERTDNCEPLNTF